MGMKTWFTFGLLGTGVSHAAQLPPPPADAALAKVYAQAQSALESFSKGAFPHPASKASWPCSVDERQLRLWAGALGTDELDEKERRNARLMNLDAGMGASEGNLVIRELQLRPVKAHCVDGHLDGVVEYLVDYAQERRFAEFVQVGTVSKHVSLTLVDGNLDSAPPVEVALKESGRKTIWFDSATQALMKKQRTAEPEQITSVTVRVVGEKGVTASVTLARGGAAGRTYGAYLSAYAGPGRREDRLYVGSELNRVYRYKGGRLHGLQESMPLKVNGIIIVPGERHCFDEGDEIKALQCDVE